MNGMAGILHQHQDAPASNGGRVCICGNWAGPWTGPEFAGHQAAALIDAGYGWLAQAWSEGHESGFWNGRSSVPSFEGDERFTLEKAHAKTNNPYKSAS